MQIKNRQQFLMIGTIAVLGLFAADRLLIDPLTATWKARAQRIGAGGAVRREEAGARFPSSI